MPSPYWIRAVPLPFLIWYFRLGGLPVTGVLMSRIARQVPLRNLVEPTFTASGGIVSAFLSSGATTTMGCGAGCGATSTAGVTTAGVTGSSGAFVTGSLTTTNGLSSTTGFGAMACVCTAGVSVAGSARFSATTDVGGAAGVTFGAVAGVEGSVLLTVGRGKSTSEFSVLKTAGRRQSNASMRDFLSRCTKPQKVSTGLPSTR